MKSHRILEEINTVFKRFMLQGLGKQSLVFPIDLDKIDDEELKEICSRFKAIFNMINESYHFSERLAQGDLKSKVSSKNIFAMPLKELQANLTHLTWQAGQIKKGDLNQKVNFLGEFSDSFNQMIESLREMKALEERFKLITDVLGEGIFLVNSEGNIIFINPEAIRLIGYTFEEIQNVSITEVIHKQEPDGKLINPDSNPLFKAIKSGNDYTNDNDIITCKSGFLMPVSLSCRVVIKDGILDGAVIAFRDITEQKKYLQNLESVNALLESQATTDVLTGIFNRMKFNDSLLVEIKKAERYNSFFSLIIFDIDHFKRVNDTYGHTAGDKVLKYISKLVSANLRDIDIFARWGGEEFVILTPETRLDGAMILAEKLRGIIETHDFYEPKKITVSFGVTTFQNKDDEITVINRADKALYQAKKNGRNQVVLHQ